MLEKVNNIIVNSSDFGKKESLIQCIINDLFIIVCVNIIYVLKLIILDLLVFIHQVS